MKFIPVLFLLISLAIKAQTTPMISEKEVSRIITELASDEMEGREIFTSGIELASKFIENEFSTIGLSYYDNLKTYRQDFKKRGKAANNVIGIIPGKSKSDEYVVFSAHYDHLGLNRNEVDKVFNGANDNASGVTAIIMLAKYFKELNKNERTIIFVAFTGEEVGGFGSAVFSESINPEKVIAMFNIEMIGTDSKWGKNSAYITGFDKSDFGAILQNNLKKSNFEFNADPYPQQQLFYRSDNARLAALGVPAHSISTAKMDEEVNYHQPSDEVSTLDIPNMTAIIHAIAISSQSIITGKDTPSRVKRL